MHSEAFAVEVRAGETVEQTFRLQPGAAVHGVARFEGTELSVSLDGTGSDHLDVEIDGAVVDVLTPSAGSGTYVLASGLTAGQHDVAITRRTESFFGITRFRGFSGGTLVPTPAPARFIEFVGDSMTCGYGVLGPGAECPFSADTEAETHAFGALTASALDAAHVAIAYSGKGVVRNYGGDTDGLLPELYLRTFADDASSAYGFDQYVPDVVVINLGTNDYSVGDPGVAFEEQLAAWGLRCVSASSGRDAMAALLDEAQPMVNLLWRREIEGRTTLALGGFRARSGPVWFWRIGG